MNQLTNAVPRHRGRFRAPVRALGRLRAAWWAEDTARPAWQGRLWMLVLLALLAWYALRVGAADWYTREPARLPDGRTIALPNVYASIDHPFHLAKERATIDALRQGRLPRWFSNHQAGFPAEFYPIGGDLLVAALYFLALGLIPLAICHKLVVIGVALLPPLAYWAIARRERLPLSVAIVATLLHLFVRGSWLAGGSRELIDYGLWPDTFASYLPLFLILWGADWVRRGERRGLLLATGAATLAIYSNPRAILGLAAAGLAVGLVALGERVRGRPRPRRRAIDPAPSSAPATDRPARFPADTRRRAGKRLGALLRAPLVLLPARGALLALLVMLLSAALLLPLRAHQELYHFTIYYRFNAVTQVLGDFIEATPLAVIQLAALGVVVGLLRRGFYGRVFALLLPLSFAIVTLVGWRLRDWPLFAQLEGPRLMPLLRPAAIFLTALAIHEIVRLAVRLCRIRGGTMLTGLATASVVGLILLAPRVPIDREIRGLPLLETTEGPVFAGIARSAFIFDAAAEPGDKPLIIGNPISWHASFFVPALTGRDVFHNDWLWFWRTTDYGAQELLQNERGALEADFLRRHGLTMLMIDAGRGDLLDLADSRSYLRLIDPGTFGGYTIYRVVGPEAAPNGWVMPERGAVTALDVRPERLTARVTSAAPEPVRIIINDFPRWRARVNGLPAPIERSWDGYIVVRVPAGDATIELDYVTEPINWIARGLVAAGLLLAGVIACGPAVRRRLAVRRRAPASARR